MTSPCRHRFVIIALKHNDHFMTGLSENPYETDNRTGVNHEGGTANTPVERLTASSIIGDTIENIHGEKLGSIDNLIISTTTGMVEYAVVELGALLGIGGKLFAIPFPEMVLNPDRRSFTLNREKAFIEGLPGFDKTQWPDTNDPYYEATNLYWRFS